MLAARMLAQSIEECLIFEDAPAGIEAAEASGASVLVISATHRTPLFTRHPTIEDYDRVSAGSDADGNLRLSARPG